MRILLVEDDPMIGEAVQDSLVKSACAVDWVKDGNAALSTLAVQHYDVVLLDLGLPGKDGMAVLQQIRSKGSDIPLIILTARDSLDHKIAGLNQGADDYIVKPFQFAELWARIQAVMRRKSGRANPILGTSKVNLNPVTKEARSEEAGPIVLSPREYMLLEALLLRPGAILSRSDLEDRIYGWGEEVESKAIEFLIHSLRRKLGFDAIKNVRGMGWMVSKED